MLQSHSSETLPIVPRADWTLTIGLTAAVLVAAALLPGPLPMLAAVAGLGILWQILRARAALTPSPVWAVSTACLVVAAAWVGSQLVGPPPPPRLTVDGPVAPVEPGAPQQAVEVALDRLSD